MTRAIDIVFDKAVKHLDRESRRLQSISNSATGTKFDHDGFSAIGRALSYVVMGGVLEELMRALPGALAADVESLQLERRHFPVSLVAAMDAENFRRCGADNVTALVERANLAKSVASHQSDSRPAVNFGDFVKLADGHTVGERHFQAIWFLLGLDGDWRNDSADSMLLKEIKQKRNDVAHWNDDPVDIGRSKRPAELISMISRLIDLVQHFQLYIWYWLDDRIAVSASGAS
jgi:hypothetical protein